MPLYTQDDVTVLIAARNAQETIRRAVASVRAQSSCPIVLVDDFSEDDTVNLARLEGGSGLTVVRPPYHGALGLTRQCGLNVIQTPLTLLLDADDAFLQGRIARFVAQMSAQPAELWADELLLFDGASDSLIRHIPIPDFIAATPVPYRMFERNYLPGVGQVGYRTELARSVGYDPELHGPEDIDLVLRVMLRGGVFAYCTRPGYAMYSYSTSVSRDLTRQKTMYARCLSKFPVELVADFFIKQGAKSNETFFSIMLMLIHQNRYSEALSYLEKGQFAHLDSHPLEAKLLTPALKWRLNFYRGSLMLKLGSYKESVKYLSCALRLAVKAEIFNNLGCAYRLSGCSEKAEGLFRHALALMPHYLDARINLNDLDASAVTLPEFRDFASRDIY